MSKLPLVVDAHTHLFNARYVPLQGILESWGIWKIPAKLISKLAYSLTASSTLKERLESFAVTTKKDATSIICNEFAHLVCIEIEHDLLKDAGNKPESAEAYQEQFINSELYSVLREIHRYYGDSESARELELDYIKTKWTFKAETQVQDKVSGWFSGIHKMIERMLRKSLEFLEDAADKIDFVLNMLRSEVGILKRLKGYYDNFSESYVLFHYMMDMAYPFDDNPKYDFYDQQLERMTALENYSDGIILGFSAFDPLRFVARSASERVIRDAIETSLEHGKAGFKFYPPMGYKPAGNAPRVERVVDHFMDFCVEHSIPVFTHCTPEGFQAYPGSGLNSDPDYWEQALTKSEQRATMRLCFGHAGGGKRKVNGRWVKGWLSTTEKEWNDSDNYARKVVELCRRYEHVYCDLSYLHEIVDDKKAQASLAERLEIELTREVSADKPYRLADKMMYGSDWHMVSMVNDIEEYFRQIKAIFETQKMQPFADRFYFKNALKYVDLAAYIARAKNVFSQDYLARLEAIKDYVA
ncbi:putative TIM-barrel fold metal-dependent hydrolase [Idiomarina loihiensis]|uniref:amidohydrolase family protein n=1 Tax=Idiomarina TaxID=135575 RepID=UPI000D713145|nr:MULTISPECIES: amidohydrolase family protein [Idiomarina]PWW36890.1 putative TIM-barrel fold metal-dependent hydrolase [Idiomarina loihiensis]TDP46698.1 putative TIM-barrel fold metal-dependent hydrolase [Idiomarina loihiensis]TDS22969.1 putative TIM-barrel fold metal-dependent hydrolase [Idiomarina sp. H2]